MKFIAAPFLALAFAPSIFASPTMELTPRDSEPTDVQVLNFALTLEHLENAFYSRALAKYSQDDFDKAGLPSWSRERFVQIGQHESTHVNFLVSALRAANADFVKPCDYNFPDNDPITFAAVSEAFEAVGTSAYNGAAQFVSNKQYLTVAASILAVEGKHAGWVSSAVRKQNPWNTAFETPISPGAAYTIASAFTTSCPAENAALLPAGLKAFPSLTLPTRLSPGQTIKFSCPACVRESKPLVLSFSSGIATLSSAISGDGKGNESAKVPLELAMSGAVYAYVQRDGVEGDAGIVAGPELVMFPFNAGGSPE